LIAIATPKRLPLAFRRTALSMYQRAWACTPDHYFEAHTKYLQLADKASPATSVLPQQIVVKVKTIYPRRRRGPDRLAV
jgi:hypothetical protein